MLVTTVTKDRRKHFSDPSVAREVIDVLYATQELHPFFLYGFVVMPDHCHILLWVPAPESISKIMNVFKGIVSLNTGLAPLWQPRFHIRETKNTGAALRYMHWNPVKAGLAENPEDYPWSSASGRWDVMEFITL